MLVKCESWPVVLPDDDGIRPAGKPDACFYCHSRVGQLHSRECVTVTKIVLFAVESNGRRVGTYQTRMPYLCDTHDMEFSRNDSTWCASNAVPDIEWTDADTREKARLLADEESGKCCCNLLEFRVLEVLDNGPFIERPALAGYHRGER